MGVPSRPARQRRHMIRLAMGYRSSSARCAPSRHPAEDHPQVLISARSAPTIASRPTFQATGCELHHIDEGEGQPVVFIHGLWLTSRFFHKQIAALSEKYRVIAPDLRGHGRSEKVLQGHTVPVQTTDLNELFTGLGMRDDIVLVGWSSGAFCVWEYVQQFGTSALKGVVIVNESPSDLKRPDWPHGMIELPSLVSFVETIQTNFEAVVRERFVQNLFNQPRESDEAAWMGDEILMTPPVIAAAVAFDELTRDYRSALAAVEVSASFAGDATTHCHTIMPPISRRTCPRRGLLTSSTVPTRRSTRNRSSSTLS
jgi:non-heme chloroperoxidase